MDLVIIFASDGLPKSAILKQTFLRWCFYVILFTILLTYNFSLDCGLDVHTIMEMEGEGGNTIKEGLDAATKIITIGILNSTFPRMGDGPTRMRRNVTRHEHGSQLRQY